MIFVFVWEYDMIFNESWDGIEINDWVYVFKCLGVVIIYFNYSV